MRRQTRPDMDVHHLRGNLYESGSVHATDESAYATVASPSVLSTNSNGGSATSFHGQNITSTASHHLPDKDAYYPEFSEMPSPGRDDLDQFWGSELDEAGIEWFLNNQCFFGLARSDLMTDGVSCNTEAPNIYSVALEDEQPAKPQPVSLRRKPIFLQEAQSKPFIVETGKFKSPDCGFRVCNALTREKRSHLLAELQQLVHDVDINEHIFSLDSMKQGIHLFFRHINIEYTFIHHEFLMPSSEESREARLAVCGSDSEPGPLLFWAIISAGWSLMRSRNNHEHIMAAKIQRALRISMMSHPGLGCSPPLWLVQALFVILLFARYQGDREEYGFASIFHGVLLEATRRLDNSSPVAVDNGCESYAGPSVMQAWIKWINTESIQRIVRHVFILDVKHALLHGGETSMMPFDLNIRLYATEDAWYAFTPEEWTRELATNTQKPISFIDMLKMLWNPRVTNTAVVPEPLPRGSNIALYGLVSIARELRRRKEISFLNRTGDASLASLGSTAIHSLQNWEPMWDKVAVPNGLTATYLWRDCSCMIHLAYTLYEVGPVDLQMVAGKTIIEGKRRGAAGYAKSRRKMGRWVKEDRAWLALSRAATVIQDRFYAGSPDVVHCHHCLWCLYLATLTCWNFGLALTGHSSSEHLVKDGKVVSLEDAEAECSQYLQVAASLPPRFHKEQFNDILGRTTGLLIVLIQFLRSQCQTGMIVESIELLARLVGVQD
ncbi:hypothetical protein SAPIO_CDS6129 [Scedosporium apiospermum]|uniref:Xylanolytic transcriptional activator regulatory domain-containing protein n=1 Tax=Pseudallescheria apiosperma TaxID=563466 RepID=A0A084G4K8_PSEDA|nr:uncharacterized protein SAPIO_CDS6129 [Scedosporium apiospermum]KEZ42270.1 hypothetical protein SAPIO_CDS6129 [Scedosporium apiospermum]